MAQLTCYSDGAVFLENKRKPEFVFEQKTPVSEVIFRLTAYAVLNKINGVIHIDYFFADKNGENANGCYGFGATRENLYSAMKKAEERYPFFGFDEYDGSEQEIENGIHNGGFIHPDAVFQ